MLSRLFGLLAAFQPTLIGTYPLGLNIDTSDLDIACACSDLDAFEDATRRALAALEVDGARIERLSVPAVVVAFAWGDIDIEISCQCVDVAEQTGFRHLVVEGQLLVLGGRELRDRVRACKRAGDKTEPAFARVLGLPGDPYAALLELEHWSPDRLRALVDRVLHPRPELVIEPYVGDRRELIALFRHADDSDQQILSYLDDGIIFVARDGGRAIGHVQMIGSGETWELKSIAVDPAYRASGLGRRLASSAQDHAARRGARRIILSTATADIALLRFYQRLGFRMFRIQRDVFSEAAGYPPEILSDGIRVLDQVWFDKTVDF